MKRIVFFFLILFSALSYADYPAVWGYKSNSAPTRIDLTPTLDSLTSICAAGFGAGYMAAGEPTFSVIPAANGSIAASRCGHWDSGKWVDGQQVSIFPALICPTGGTLNGTMCVVVANKCPPSDGITSVWSVKMLSTGLNTSGRCNGSCKFHLLQEIDTSQKSDNSYQSVDKSGQRWFTGYFQQVWDGAECTADDTSDGRSGPKPPIPPKHPICDDSEGVLTTSAGHVACVPPGTDDAKQPIVKKDVKVETYPDNSTKKTETVTTTDPASGATDVRSTSTSTGGQSGAAGTTQTEGSSSGSGGSGGKGGGDGSCDPTLNFCGGPGTDGLYKKKDATLNSVFDKFVAGINETPVVKSFTGFLDVNVPSSGACPDLRAEVPFLNASIDATPYICTGKALEYMAAMGSILKIMCLFIAFRWVLL